MVEQGAQEAKPTDSQVVSEKRIGFIASSKLHGWRGGL
jgi:hypothetical protein